jgi:predicted nicotinamide N-methyase
MRITIIGVDNSVYVDGAARGGLDLSGCGLPENFWAFQWNERGDDTGHIEYNSPMIQNDEVTEIPSWATACVAVWQAKLDQEAAEAEAMRLAAQNSN